MNQWTAILPLALSLSLFACDSGSAPAAPAKPAEAAPAKPADAAPAKPADAAPATPADETKEALDEADAALKAAGELGQLDSLKALGDAKGLSGVVDEDDLSCSKGSCVQQLADRDASCSGGGCTQTCTEGTCDISCSGGGCTQTCAKGTTCKITCTGDGCTQACDEASSCDKR